MSPSKRLRTCRRVRNDAHGERGAILILALAYITVIGVVVAAITTWASGDLNNTDNFTSARNLDYSLSSAVEVAGDRQNIRYTPEADSVNVSVTTGPVACWGSGSTSTYELPGSTNNIATWCSTLSDPGTATTRTVTISACTAATSPVACAATPQLQAVIVSTTTPPRASQPMARGPPSRVGTGPRRLVWRWHFPTPSTSTRPLPLSRWWEAHIRPRRVPPRVTPWW